MQRRSARGNVVTAVARAAARWCNSGFPPRVRALARVAERTRYSVPVVAYAFDRLFRSITAEALDEAIAREVGEARRFEPLGRVAVISSRTTIGVAIVPAIFALCAGCDVLVKDREDSLVAAFFETLAEDSELLASAHAEAWDGERDARDLATYDAVVAFGSNDALYAIRARLRPDARFIAYGPKASIGYVARAALASEATAVEIASGAARALVLYDGEGCLSLHALFVEYGARISPEHFLELLAAAVERACVEESRVA